MVDVGPFRNKTECNPALDVSFLAVYTVQALVIFIGNFLTCIVFLSKKRLRQVYMNVFLISLAMSDFLVSVLVFPGYVVLCVSCVTSQYDRRHTVCIILDGLKDYVLLTNVFSVLCITFDRYIAVLRPFKYLTTITKRSVIVMLVSSWLLPWPIAYMKQILMEISPTIFHDKLARTIYDNIVVFLCIISPMFGIAVINCMITKVIRKQHARIHYHSNMNIASYQPREDTSFNQGSRDGSNDHITSRQEESYNRESRSDSQKSRDVNDLSLEQLPSDVALQPLNRSRDLTEETYGSRDDKERETALNESLELEIQDQSYSCRSLQGQSSKTESYELDLNDKVSHDNRDVASDVTQSNKDYINSENLADNVSVAQTFHPQDISNVYREYKQSDNSKTQDKVLSKSSKMRCSFKVTKPSDPSRLSITANGGFSLDEEHDRSLDDTKPSMSNKPITSRRVKNKHNKDSCNSSTSLTERLRKISRELRESNGTRSCLVVSMIFVVCWIPRCLLNIFRLFLSRDFVDDDLLERMSMLFLFFQSLMNPLVYSFYRKDFRQAAKEFLYKFI